MSIENFPGYHACSLDGGYEQVRNGIPFISDDTEEQWLTQGYYFWNHSSRYAKSWIPKEYRKGGSKYGQQPKRAIGCFDLNIENASLWDLVGNPRHHDELEVFANQMIQKYKRVRTKPTDVSIHEIIAEMREVNKDPKFTGMFPYVAVKAVDDRKKDVSYYKFTASGNEGLRLPVHNAQQVCVFEKTEENIVLKSFLEPMEFKIKFIAESSKEI